MGAAIPRLKTSLLVALLALAIAACGSATEPVTVTTGTSTYSTNFDLTENPISEGGVWLRRSGTVFTDVRTVGGIALGTNGARNDYDDSYALLSGFGPDQQAEAVVARLPNLMTGVTHEVELLLRFSDDATTARGYECTFNYVGEVLVAMWNGILGDFTPLSVTGGAGNLGRDLVSGDIIKCSIAGNVISLYINGSLRGQATDSTFAGGQPGIGFFTRPNQANVVDNSNFGLSSYTVTSN
jgi:hypothetical protein